ncbi:MAG: phosphopantetheine-binding protein [Pseudomonadota bacterium]
MTDEVAKRIAGIIAEQALVDPDEIKPDTTPDDLGLDSLAIVEVVFGIEEAFDLSVPYNANEPNESDFDIGNFASIVEGVKGLIAQKDAAS